MFLKSYPDLSLYEKGCHNKDMNMIPFESYGKIFDALIDAGYSEEEAEQLICDVITDQRDFDNYGERIHSILERLKNEDMKS